MAVVAILSAVIGYWTNCAQRQRSDIAKIVEAGGDVEYWYYYEYAQYNDSWTRHGEARTWVPRWIRRTLGEDYFSSIIAVRLSCNSKQPVDIDELMQVVGRFRQLRFLDLTNQDITDDGLKHIARLTSLEELHLQGAKISDDGMCHLAQLYNLVNLDLSLTGISDAGLLNGRIGDKQRLRHLDLLCTSISDDGLLMLASLPNLSGLSVYASNVTEEGKRRFQELRSDVDL